MNSLRALGWKLFRAFLFVFDAETAHRIVGRLMRLMMPLGGWPFRLVSGARKPESIPEESRPRVLGMRFLSPVGLAAGFDKDAEFLRALPHLGFGFAEIGTVTPRPQPGNDRPRLFRDVEKQALFNRMGFNGLGATLVSARLAEAKPHLPSDFRVGVNIGKNKDTSNEKAAEDYVAAIRPFEDLADYVVINVSSPNTPGLRSLQTVEALKPILLAVHEVLSGWKKRPPLLLKLAPELDAVELQDLFQELEATRAVDGWVLTNTLGGEWKLSDGRILPGGWSGSPLSERSRDRLTVARSLTRLPILSVGGIMTPEEGRTRRRTGADLVQIYSGWIFRGPRFPVEVAERWSVF